MLHDGGGYDEGLCVQILVFCVTQHKGAAGSDCTITQSWVVRVYLVFHIKRTKVTGAIAHQFFPGSKLGIFNNSC